MRYFKLITILLVAFAINAYGEEKTIIWSTPFDGNTPCIDGRGWNKEIGNNFHRFPDRAKKVMRDPVWSLSRNSTGLSIRFITNAPEITVKYQVEEAVCYWNMTPIVKSGLDMYVTDSDGITNWCAAPGNAYFPMNNNDTICYHYKHLVYHNPNGAGSEYEMFLPLYNTVKWLQIGVPEGSKFKYCAPYSDKPIVVYGTSIAQGASASRPAMAWSSIIKRHLGVPLYNLGFSGNARMDEAVYDMLCEIDARLYILDCMENMYGIADEIADRTVAGVTKLRKHSDAPILLVEHCGFGFATTNEPANQECIRTNQELHKAYMKLKAMKVPNIYYLSKKELGLDVESQVDGWHASDIGMNYYAKAYLKKINKILPDLAKRKWKYRLQ